MPRLFTISAPVAPEPRPGHAGKETRRSMAARQGFAASRSSLTGAAPTRLYLLLPLHHEIPRPLFTLADRGCRSSFREKCGVRHPAENAAALHFHRTVREAEALDSSSIALRPLSVTFSVVSVPNPFYWRCVMSDRMDRVLELVGKFCLVLLPFLLGFSVHQTFGTSRKIEVSKENHQQAEALFAQSFNLLQLRDHTVAARVMLPLAEAIRLDPEETYASIVSCFPPERLDKPECKDGK